MYQIVTFYFVYFVPESNGDILPVSYKKLFDMLQERNLKKFWLRQNGINPKTVNALVNNANVNVSTIMELCKLLDCQPGDIMEYIPDDQ